MEIIFQMQVRRDENKNELYHQTTINWELPYMPSIGDWITIDNFIDSLEEIDKDFLGLTWQVKTIDWKKKDGKIFIFIYLANELEDDFF